MYGIWGKGHKKNIIKEHKNGIFGVIAIHSHLKDVSK